MLAHRTPFQVFTLKIPSFLSMGHSFGMKGIIAYWMLPCLLVINSISAQEYTIRDIEINANEESHKYMNFMQMDKDGFLWYSTHNGLVKDFESHSVLSSFSDENAGNLPKWISGFYIDSRQRIWISATTGIFVSEKGLDVSFNRIKFKPFLKGSELQANSFMEDCDGNLWIAAGARADNIVLKVDPSLAVTEYQIPGLESRHVYASYYLRGYLHFERRIGCDKFLVRQGRKLFILDKGKASLVSDFTASLNYHHHSNFPYPEWPRNGGDGLLITDNGDILPESMETQYIYEGEIFKTHFVEDLNIQVLNLPDQEMIPITEDGNPILKNHVDLIGIDGSGKTLVLFKMVDINGSFQLKKAYEIPFPNLIDDVIIDKNDIIYVSSNDRISKIKFGRSSFDKILDRYGDQKVDVRGFLELPNKEILAATNEGVFKLTPSDDPHGKSSFETTKVFVKGVLGYQKSFAKVSDSTAWCLGESRGLVKINFLRNTKEEVHVFQSHGRLPSLHYYDILKSSDSTLLLASHYGIHEFNTGQNKFRELPIPIIENNRELFVWDLHKTKDRLLIGTDANGLFIQDLGSNAFLHLNKDPTKGGLALPSNKVHSIFVDGQESIWLGTDKGAVEIDRDLKKLMVINRADGLTNLNVVGILEDADGNMWFSTHNGLYRYGKSSKKITAFYVEDGLTSNDFNQIAYFKSSTGKLLFGGINGLVAFDSVADTARSREIGIFPTKFEYYDPEEEKEVALDVLNRERYSFSLPHNKNSFSVSYTINDCYNTATNKYAYRLDGFTDDWVDLGSQTTLKLLSIPPGDYALRIKGLNSAGTESSNELRYDINVAEIFYKRPWVQAVAAVFLLGMLVLGIASYTLRERKKYRLRLAMVELERKALRTQMNPHFLFNMLNRIRKKVKNAKLLQLEKYVATFSSLMRLTLDMTRNDNITLSKEIQYIQNYVALTNTESGNEIVLTIQCDPEIDASNTFIPSMILQPIVENSIVHGFVEGEKEKNIILKMERSAATKQLILTVTDDGIGISQAEKNSKAHREHQSYATQILHERLRLLNQISKKGSGYGITIKDIGDGTKTGTEVVVKIPY